MNEHTEAAPDRGIAMRVTVSADDGSMIEMTSIVPEECSRDGLQTRAEKLNSACRGVRAKTQLPALRAECEETRKILEENEQRLAGLDASHQKAVDQHETEILKGNQRIHDLKQAGADAWAESGRQGPYDPRGADKKILKDIENIIGARGAAKEKAVAEYQQAWSQLTNEIQRKTTAVEILRRRIDECERLARGEDISGVD